MNVNYATLEKDVIEGTFCQELAAELTIGFRTIHMSGERLPPVSYYASRMADIVNRGAPEPLDSDLAYHVYQEIVLACEQARAAVLGEEAS